VKIKVGIIVDNDITIVNVCNISRATVHSRNLSKENIAKRPDPTKPLNLSPGNNILVVAM